MDRSPGKGGGGASAEHNEQVEGTKWMQSPGGKFTLSGLLPHVGAGAAAGTSLDIELAPVLEEQMKEATWQTENLVFDRDEYARKEFWDDRFKE
jgi:hypothetical protein